MKQILSYFPRQIAYVLENEIKENWKELEEIRFRAEKPIILKYNLKESILKYKVNQQEILEIIQRICENSIYSYQEQICNRIYYN